MGTPQLENGYTRMSNELLEALARMRIPGESWQMLNVIIRKTYGFGKKADHISTSQFREATGLSKGAVHKARKKLLDLNIISVSKKGYTSVLMYSIQKLYKNWRVYPKKGTVPKKGTGGTQKRNGVYPKKGTKCTPKGSTQKKERNSTKETLTKERRYSKDFETFWDIYERKGNKIKASQMWEKLTSFDRIDVFAIVNEYVKSTPEKQFRNGAEKYLNPKNRHWEDEITPSKAQTEDNRPGVHIQDNMPDLF